MFEYLLIIIVTIIFIRYNQIMAKNTRIFSMFIILIAIILLMGLRYNVGIDTINYTYSYKNIPNILNLSSIDLIGSRSEPGYLIISSICKYFTNDFCLLQLVMTAITNTCIFIFIYQRCRNPFLGVLIYFILAFLYFTTEVIRESAAVGIFLLNYRNIENRRWIKYYFLCIISICFHYSAIITFFIPLAHHIKLSPIYFILIIGLISIAPFIDFINQALNITLIADKVQSYSRIASNVNLNFRLAFFIRLGIPALIILIVSRYRNIHIKYESMILLHLLLCAGIFAIPIIFSRLTNYTLLFIVITIANIQYNLKSRNFLIALLLITLSQSHYYLQMYRAWIPYVSIFDKHNVKERERLWWDNFHN